MYQRYWGFEHAPFCDTRDPVWYFAAPQHEEALARLLYVIEQNHPLGWLHGRHGHGKSLLLHVLKDQLNRAAYQTALIDMSGMDTAEWLWNLSTQWRLSPLQDDTPERLWRRLRERMASSRALHEPTAIMIDHFDYADEECRRSLDRLLSVASRESQHITLIMVVEQPERVGTDTSSMLAQRLRDGHDLDIRLDGLDTDGVSEYIEFRLKLAGARTNPFTVDAVSEIADRGEGMPSRINKLCELSLLAAMGRGVTVVHDELVVQVADELIAKRRQRASRENRPSPGNKRSSVNRKTGEHPVAAHR